MSRYYYKRKDGNGLLNLKTPSDRDDYVAITEEEYTELSKANQPTETEKFIANSKAYLTQTDYVVLKLAEAQAEGNTEEVEKIKTEYAEVLAQRKATRLLINSLQ